ncbi:glycosyltransferase [Rheinheimera sp. MMS21-TC3]|uniref:glycosyltransferase n=1 Tax=Rheinheimera sp. MMS21-TC3 TaxID=3072790 RepID=UPI0028C461D3|nr:glycosyltransferase [Rheinheimera sp. MMS21-TC3]WNO61697.1 glycosyltransferase [Rheinheimera sp. MMS21-TC3]
MKNNSVVHVTSVHPRYDTRIFLKMCNSLAMSGKNVSLIVADGKGDELSDKGVTIYDVGLSVGRLSRMLKTTKLVYNKAIELKADVYHLHDPELIPIGLKLKKKGFKVVFDAHEDLPKQLKSKPYLNVFFKKILPLLFEFYEKFSLSKFDALVGATPSITSKLSKLNCKSYNINNYPIIGELNQFNDTLWSEKADEVCYLGGITEIRGIKEVILALPSAPCVRLNLAGRFSEPHIEQEVKSCKAWEQVNELGFIDRTFAAEILGRSKAGIVTFHDYPNHIDAQPNKMFEYMSAGLPIITSNFPMWRELVEGEECGICVEPTDPKAIADAINFIIRNPEDANRMGKNGLRAVQLKYNWAAEEKTLLTLYKEI